MENERTQNLFLGTANKSTAEYKNRFFFVFIFFLLMITHFNCNFLIYIGGISYGLVSFILKK